MPDAASELLAIYDQALDLTRRQARAIQESAWEELLRLLSERGALIERAEALLKKAGPGRRPELAERLRRLEAADDQNRRHIEHKRALMEADLKEVETTREALSGYLEALKGPVEPHFFDRDQ